MVTTSATSGKWKLPTQFHLCKNLQRPVDFTGQRRSIFFVNIRRYFFKYVARNTVVRFHASAVSVARYPSLLFGFSKPWPASG